MAETGPTAEQHLFVVRTFLAKADRDRDFQSRAIDAFEVFVRALQQENETLRKRIEAEYLRGWNDGLAFAREQRGDPECTCGPSPECSEHGAAASVEDREKLRTENDEMRKRLYDWADHEVGCTYDSDRDEGRCSCGLDALLGKDGTHG
jgi:regulator of replication initiation timing